MPKKATIVDHGRTIVEVPIPKGKGETIEDLLKTQTVPSTKRWSQR